MLLISGMKAERIVKGFEILESLSEDLMARENVVNAETPFSPTLSVCGLILSIWLETCKHPTL